ncbi:MAG: hypothetical protein ACRYG4_26445, partial [Janthinobacterium lividum]
MISTHRFRWLGATALSCAFAAGTVVAEPLHKHHVDPRDKRIEALEAQVSALTKIVTGLQDRPAAVTAAPVAVASAPGAASLATRSPVSAGQLASNVRTNGGDASPPATSPDQVRPVTTSAPGPSAGGVTMLAGKPSLQSPDGRFV